MPDESYYPPESQVESDDFHDSGGTVADESLFHTPEEEAELQAKVLELLQKQNDDMFSGLEMFLSDLDSYKESKSPKEETQEESKPILEAEENPFEDFPGTLNETGISDSNNDLQTLFSQGFGGEDIFSAAPALDPEPENKSFDPSLMFEDYESEEPRKQANTRVSYGNKNYQAFSYSENSASSQVKQESEVSTPVVFLILAIILFIGYTAYQKMNKRYDLEPNARRETRRKHPRKMQDIFNFTDKKPLWSAVRIKSDSSKQEQEFIKSALLRSGRANPFLVPDSILQAMASGRASATSSFGKSPTVSRKAYRALMVGVVQANGETIALVSLKEASFEIPESATRSKVLKAAIRAMDKALDSTIEASVGDYIANWELTEIHSPNTGDLGEPFLKLNRKGETKILNLAKAEELGIFNEDNQLDDLSGFEID